MTSKENATRTTLTMATAAPTEHHQQPNVSAKELHIAPMIRFSDRDFRAFLRILTRRCIIWTEMMADNTVIHWNPDRRGALLQVNGTCHRGPLVAQIGGNDAVKAGKATGVLRKYGYSEINLNCGCPSERVAGKNDFGAALMKRPLQMAEIVQAMLATVRSNDDPQMPTISIKTRIGVDSQDSTEHLRDMIGTIIQHSDCRRFYLHARKVHLKGLNARQNRTIPPLDYVRVFEMCHQFPAVEFWLNGGIGTLGLAKRLCFGTEYMERSAVKKNKSNHARKRRKPKMKDTCGCDEDDDNDNMTDSDSSEDEEDDVVLNTNNRVHNPPRSRIKQEQNRELLRPLSIAPDNLRGCMMGRAAINNVAMFADADRYFYEDPTGNPCKNRRQALAEYCEYLEDAYPRRCCDEDPRATTKYPPPEGIEPLAPYCDICESMYGSESGGSNDYVVVVPSNLDEDSTPTVDSDATVAKVITKRPEKVSNRVAGTTIKPVLSIFAGLPCNKAFRQRCDRLCRDEKIRNCGPGFALRLAMKEVPDKYLDSDFVSY